MSEDSLPVAEEDIRYVPLLKSMLTDFVWDEDDDTRIVWVTLHLMADDHGYVPALDNGIAHEARKSVEVVTEVMVKLCKAKHDPRNPTDNGQRVWRVSGGYFIPSIPKIREKIRLQDRSRAAARMARMRERKNKAQQTVTVLHTETDTARD